MARRNQQEKPRPSQPADPLSDLVTASELRAWRNDITTQKILRYLTRWRGQVLEYMGDGGTIAERAEATATLTVEASAKAQILKDIVELEAVDLARFYGLEEPNERAKA